MGLVVVLDHRFCGLFLRPEATKQLLVVGNYYKRLVIVALWYSHMPGEISQSGRVKNCMLSLIYGTQNRKRQRKQTNSKTQTTAWW